jgi:hypothetical protein
MKKLLYCGISILILLLVFTAQSIAFQVGAGAFGPGAIVESFEGLTAGPNITSGGEGYLEPGVVSPFTFASGVTFTNPVPNPGRSTGVIICDWAIGIADFTIGGNGSVGSAADVPFGSAYIALDNSASSGPIEFTFPTDMLRAGAYVTGYPGTIIMSAYDSGGILLETQNIATVNVSAWDSNFLGIENPAGIRRITFGGDYELLDGLTFEAASTPPTPIPTLSEWGMIIFSLMLAGSAIWMMRRRQVS